MAKLYFTGIKHSGKTTQARLVAQLLQMPHADSDDLVLSLVDCPSVRDFYREHGKVAFMEKEKEAVMAFASANESFILSLGGGAADNAPLMRFMAQTGRIIYLARDEKDMLPVILKHGTPAFLDPDDLEGSFSRVFAKRDSIYRDMADLTIDLGPYGDREETARMVMMKLKENGYA